MTDLLRNLYRQSNSYRSPSGHPAVEALEVRALMAGTPLAVSEMTFQGGRALYVPGTEGDDQVIVARTDAGLTVTTATGWSGTFSGNYRVLVVDGKGGDDEIMLDDTVFTRAVLFG